MQMNGKVSGIGMRVPVEPGQRSTLGRSIEPGQLDLKLLISSINIY
jgi:hypothetical protein